MSQKPIVYCRVGNAEQLQERAMSHTSGPWECSRNSLGELSIWRQSDGVHVLHSAGELPLAEREANGQLMSAAPDLLEACKAAAEYLDCGTPIRPGSDVELQMRLAIAKATE